MADLVNLRQFRKRKLREEKEQTAKTNRTAYGRSRVEKELTRSLNEKERRDHDAGRLETPSATHGDTAD